MKRITRRKETKLYKQKKKEQGEGGSAVARGTDASILTLGRVSRENSLKGGLQMVSDQCESPCGHRKVRQGLLEVQPVL